MQFAWVSCLLIIPYTCHYVYSLMSFAPLIVSGTPYQFYPILYLLFHQIGLTLSAHLGTSSGYHLTFQFYPISVPPFSPDWVVSQCTPGYLPPSTHFFLTPDKWVPLDLSVLPHTVPPFSPDWVVSQCTPGYLL